MKDVQDELEEPRQINRRYLNWIATQVEISTEDAGRNVVIIRADPFHLILSGDVLVS